MPRFKVCLDPGHSGSDPGAIGPTGVQEKVVALAVAAEVRRQLLRAGCEVFMTRNSDIDVSLAARSREANELEANVFVSIHANAHSDKQANGTETYHYPGSEAGKALAGAIQHALVAQLKRRDRGVRNANFAVLRETNMPAALVEIAFISNYEEEGMLESPAFQAKAARAIATGIAGYLGLTLPMDAEKDVVVPSWAKDAVMWAVANGLITNQAGSEDFYRFITTLYRFNRLKK